MNIEQGITDAEAIKLRTSIPCSIFVKRQNAPLTVFLFHSSPANVFQSRSDLY
jgi:hypothetical protein